MMKINFQKRQFAINYTSFQGLDIELRFLFCLKEIISKFKNTFMYFWQFCNLIMIFNGNQLEFFLMKTKNLCYTKRVGRSIKT